MQVVLGIPGMTQTRQNMLSRRNPSSMAPGQMSVLHLPYSEEFEETLLRERIKILFISRDLRDVAVSLMYFIERSFPSHVLFPVLENLSRDERLSVIINGLDFHKDLSDTVLANELFVAHGHGLYPNIQGFWSPFSPWITCKAACHVTFEELSQPSPERTAALRRIVNFLWEDLSALGIPKGMLVTQMERNINPATSPTFRAGRIGDWKSEFKAHHTAAFKSVAGQTLIDLGYESDFHW